MNNVEKLAELFGSKKSLAQAWGVDAAIVSRAVKGEGRVPVRFNRRTLDAMRYKALGRPDAESFIDGVIACLDPSVCPTCGHDLDMDRVV